MKSEEQIKAKLKEVEISLSTIDLLRKFAEIPAAPDGLFLGLQAALKWVLRDE